jgi:hypothetical protein
VYYKISGSPASSAAHRKVGGGRFPVVSCKCMYHKELVTGYEKITIFFGIHIDDHIRLLYDNDTTQ